jgi:hypothetical protein
MFKFALILFSLLPSLAWTNDNIAINLGIFYAEKRIYRGALIWDAPIIAAGPSFTFFKTVQLGAGGLSLGSEIAAGHTLSLGVSTFNDNAPDGPIIKLADDEEDFKNRRRSTIDASLKYEYRFERFFSWSLAYHKDIKRHNGSYLFTGVSTSIIPFITLGTGIGLGDRATNQYVYGAGACGGLGHWDSYASLFLPILPWEGRLRVVYNYSTIKKESNAYADFIRGERNNTNLNAMALWSF